MTTAAIQHKDMNGFEFNRFRFDCTGEKRRLEYLMQVLPLGEPDQT